MVRIGEFVGPVILVLWIFCAIDVILCKPEDARNLPKWGWLVLVLLFPLVGSVAWLVAGRPSGRARRPRAHEREAPQFPEYDRPGRAAAISSETDEEFLRRCRERAEEQRRRYREEHGRTGPEPEPEA